MIDPWQSMKGMFWLFACFLALAVGLLVLAVKILVWLYRGGRWAWRKYHA